MPRMYNKKVGQNAIDNRTRKRVGQRDAIVWSVDEGNDIVNLKIQGSDTLLVAHYHQVLNAVPTYIKPGAAVTVRHRRNNKGYVEIIGTGRAIPTPVGASAGLPVVGATDVVVSGMEVLPTDPTSMTVRVNPGVYRLDNTLHVWSKTNNFFYTMNDPPELIMGTDPVTMGGQYYVVTIPAAPVSEHFGRYDLLVVGPHDGEIDVISGAEVNLSTTEPVMPSVPVNHVMVDWVLVFYGETVVTAGMIGKKYNPPSPQDVTVTLSTSFVTDQQLEWNPAAPPSASCVVIISVEDQYGSTIDFNGARGRLTLSGGFGEVDGGYTGWSSDWAESSHGTQVQFQYRREQTNPDENHPVLVYDVEGFTTAFVIILLDSLGDPL